MITVGKEAARGIRGTLSGKVATLEENSRDKGMKTGLLAWSLRRGWNVVCWKGNNKELDVFK